MDFEDRKKESFLFSIGSSFLWKGLDRFITFLKHILIAAFIGLSAQLDVFYMSISFFGIFIYSWANLVDLIAVPKLVNRWQEKNIKEFKLLSGGFINLSFLISIFLLLIILFFRNNISNLAIGFDTERKQFLAESFVLLSPVIFLYIPNRLLTSILRSIRRFSLAYISEFIISFTTLIIILLFKNNPKIIFISFSIATFSSFLYLLIFSYKFFNLRGSPFSPKILNFFKIVPSLFLLNSAHYFYALTDKVFISYLPIGSVSALSYALSLVTLMPGLLSLGGGFLTIISEKEDFNFRSKKLNDLISLIIFIGIPITIFLLLEGNSITQILLQRGMFSNDDTLKVGKAISAYTWLIIPNLISGPIDQIFFIENKINLMTRRIIYPTCSNIFLNYLFLFVYDLGIFGIALATSISYWIMFFVSINGLNKIGYIIDYKRHLKWSIWNGLFISIVYLAVKNNFLSIDNIFLKSLFTIFLFILILVFSSCIYPGKEKLLISSIYKRIKSKLII